MQVEVSAKAALFIEQMQENNEEKKAILCDAFSQAVNQLVSSEKYDALSLYPLQIISEYNELIDELSKNNYHIEQSPKP